KIVSSQKDLPEGAETSGDYVINGAFASDGTIYLVAGNLNKANAYPTLLHEALHAEHAQNGWKGLFGKNYSVYESVRAQYEQMLETKHEGLTAAHKQAEEAGVSAEHMFEETLAYFVTNTANHKTSLFRRILHAVRAWAVRAGLKKNVTADDMVALAEAAIRRQARGSSETGKAVKTDSVLYSKQAKKKSYQLAMEKYQKAKDEQKAKAAQVTQNLISRSPGATEETKIKLSEIMNRVEGDRTPSQSRMDVLKEALVPAFNKYSRWILDRNRPLKVVQRKLKKISDEMNVFQKETARPKVAAYEIKKAWEEQFQPLIEQIAKAGLALPDVEEYAHAVHVVKDDANQQLRNAHSLANLEDLISIYKKEGLKQRAKDIAAKIKQIKGNKDIVKSMPAEYYNILSKELAWIKPENESAHIFKQNIEVFYEQPAGMSDKKAAEIIEAWENNPEIESIRKQITAINKGRLDILRDAGSITEEEYEAYLKKYQYFVPLHREGFEDGSKTGIGTGLQPGGRQVKTRGGSLREVVDIFGNTVKNYETALAVSEKAASTRALKALVDANPLPKFWRLKAAPKAPRYDKQGNLRSYPDLNQKVDNEFQFMVDGKLNILEVNRDDKDAMYMLRALKNEDQQTGVYLKHLSRIQKYLSLINTMYSPGFAIYNFERDIQAAMTNIGSTAVAGKEMDVLKLVKSSLKDVYKAEQGKGSTTMYDRFRTAGGKIEWSDMHQSARDVSKIIEKELAYAKGERPVRKTIRSWNEWVHSINTAVENAVRLSAFTVGVQNGMTDAQAGQMASDLTVDFTKHGEAGPLLNSLYLFANAGIQGNYRMLRGLAKSKKVRKRAAGIMLAGFAQGLWLAMVGDDDIDEHTRQRNIIFKIPGVDVMPKVALPWGFSVLWNFGDELARFATDKNYKVMKGSTRLAGSLIDSFNPVAGGTILQTVTPTLGDPLAMAYENKNWFGGSLMPPKNPFSKVPEPDSQRYWKSTSAPSKWVAETVNELWGGNKARSGLIDFSPETLDMVVDFVGGGALRFVKDVALAPQRAYSGELEIRHVPIIRRMLHEPNDRNIATKYYDRIKEVLTVEEELKIYYSTARYDKIKKSKSAEMKLIGYTKNTEKILRRLRDAKKRTDDKDKLKKLDNKIKQIQSEYNKHYDEVSAQH
ncbi:MAG: LPD38 domain-containing protein, partial [Thermodesulfobacteriota bacterium]|nr:LPD38 domain-containing protein [Thermodesulfobacteriota bacterium]